MALPASTVQTDDKTTTKKRDVLTKLHRVGASLWQFTLDIIRFFLPGYFPESNKTPALPVVEVDENDIHRLRMNKSAVRHYDLPKNMFEILYRGRDLSNNGPCLGSRASKTAKYEWLSFQETINRATNFGAGLVAIGCKADCEYLIGIMAKTCLEWTVAEFGCFAYGMATAPLHDSLGPDICQETIDTYEIEVMICGGDQHIETLLHDGKCPKKLRIIVTMPQLSGDRVAELENLGIKVLTFAQVEDLGRKNPLPLRLAPSDSLASLIFTSGTTGIPKGPMLTHFCFMESMKTLSQSNDEFVFTPEDSLLGLFPLSHIFERICEKQVHLHGGKVGYLSGDILDMMSDAQELKPTVFAFVPRLMNRLYDQITLKVQKSAIARLILPIALAAKTRDMQKGIFRTDTIWDALLFRKCQSVLGGKIKIAFTGSAPSDGIALNFMRAALGCYISEMYAQTESGGPTTGSAFGDLTTDHVGIPYLGVEVKLVDVPELGYFAKHQNGEVCCRSSMQMKGYYKMPQKTAETIDEEGWLHTGDIGCWLPNGNLKIIDRKKYIFKLSQGEYLAPERIESILSRSSLITNVFVDGDARYPYCVALIYPSYDALQVSPGQITHDGRKSSHEVYVREKIMEDMLRLGKDAKLKSYEVPKKFAILQEPFSLENGCLTTSQKTKRDVVRTMHKSDIQKLYESD